MSNFFRCLSGPRLYRLYRTENRQEGRDYTENAIEHYSDGFFKTAVFTVNLIWSLSLYVCPVIASVLYKRGYFTPEGMISLGKSFGVSGILLFIAMCIRGIGRMMNYEYLSFIISLDAYKEHPSRDLKVQISQYDFDFRHWPVDFRWNESTLDQSKPKLYIKNKYDGDSIFEKCKNIPLSIISFFAIHTFGRMMIYPGSVGLMNMLLWKILCKGRNKLMEEHNAERYKLLTRDGNEIDSMFVDRRHNRNYPNGDILVICCEGNSGFYEFGITGTPIGAGYSVFGWNHPGFGCSTGTPFPGQELNAMDVVMQFAVSKLKFREENIVIYAWSIGGFSATWAAMNYPNIKGLVLDATFDDLTALAKATLPTCLEPIVIRTIREYMDLHNAEQLAKYDGPVLMIRRSKDEIIATRPSRSLETNRGNDLLIDLLRNRYPTLITDDTLSAVRIWVSGDKKHQTSFANQSGVEEDLCETYLKEHAQDFPMHIGKDLPMQGKVQLLLYLAKKHMIDFDSTHCVPLPSAVFQLPWQIQHESNSSETIVSKSHM